MTNASSVAIGAALHQKVGDEYKPIAFYSKKLTPQLLAAFQALVHIRSLVEGQQLTLVSDHKPLVTAFYSQVPAKSDRQQRQLAILTEYVTQAIHTRGCDNVVADALSRCVSSVQVDPIDLSSITATQQQHDDKSKTLKDRLTAFSLYVVKYCVTPVPRTIVFACICATRNI